MKRKGVPARRKKRYPVFAQAVSIPVRFCNACKHNLNMTVCMCCPLFAGISPGGEHLVLKNKMRKENN